MTALHCAETLEDLVAMVQGHLETVCALVTRVSEGRQFVLAQAGRALPGFYSEPTTLDYSICQHCVAMDFPLVIDDALSHPLMRGNRAVSEVGIAAYLGAPLRVKRGAAVGAVCALEFHQRRWTDDDILFITEATHVANRLAVKLI